MQEAMIFMDDLFLLLFLTNYISDGEIRVFGIQKLVFLGPEKKTQDIISVTMSSDLAEMQSETKISFFCK